MYKRCSYFKALISKATCLKKYHSMQLWKSSFSCMLTLKAKPLDSVYKIPAWCSFVFRQCCYWLGIFLWKKTKTRWGGNKKKPFRLIRQLFFRKIWQPGKDHFFNLIIPLAKVSWLSYELWEIYHLYIALNTFSLTGNSVTDILVIWKNRTPCNLDLL